MKFRFHPGARREFDDAIDYYEEQKAGLGDRSAESWNIQ
jgi:hypothetical protein